MLAIYLNGSMHVHKGKNYVTNYIYADIIPTILPVFHRISIVRGFRNFESS